MSIEVVHNPELHTGWSIANFSRICGDIVHGIHINSIERNYIDGRLVYIKRRNAFGRRVLPAANWFFRISRSSISFWTQPSDWQQWEIDSFSMLNPGYEARCVGKDAILEEAVPGESLWTIAKRGGLTPGMLDAAGMELRRAHGFRCGWFAGPWSHGDGAMCNVIFDGKATRARLIDFELIHDRALRPAERHAQDLLSFLLDLVGVASEDEWMPYALRYLRAYGKGRAIRPLCDVLPPPRGIARLWWKIRGNFADERKIAPRLDELRRALVDSNQRYPVLKAARDGAFRKRRRRARLMRWSAQPF